MDSKYGRLVAERKDIPDDEPLFLLRGQDALAPGAVENYAEMVRATLRTVMDGNTAQRVQDFADDCNNVAAAMRMWQAAHPDRVKFPD